MKVILPEANPTKFNDMPVGLEGYWWETENQVCVPFVANQNEGDGNFSKWLKEQESKGKVVFFPTIISARLEAILRSRGYVEALATLSKEEREMYGQEYCDGLALLPAGKSLTSQGKGE